MATEQADVNGRLAEENRRAKKSCAFWNLSFTNYVTSDDTYLFPVTVKPHAN